MGRSKLLLAIATAAAVAVIPAIASATPQEPVEPAPIDFVPAGMTPGDPANAQHVSAIPNNAEQDPVSSISLVADTLHALGASSGFAGQSTDAEQMTIHLYWKGKVPVDVRQYVDQAPEDVTVTVSESATYSRAEAQKAATALAESEPAERSGVQSVSVNHQGDGLTVGFAGDIPDERTRAELTTAAGLPASDVQWEADIGEFVFSAARTNDSAPWKGGGRTRHGASSVCSTGFAVLSGSAGRLLTAAHCNASSSKQAVKDGAGHAIAPASGVASRCEWRKMLP